MVLALCVPAMAASVTVSDGGNTNYGEVDVVLTADAGIVGIGLKVDGDVITGFAVDSFFDVFIDSAYTTGSGYGTVPTALQSGPGELALPSGSFSISVGGLDDDGIGAGTEEAPLTVTITLTGIPGESVTITEDTLRGGIVGYDGAMTISGLPLTVTYPPSECVKDTAPFYADWVGAGKSWDKPDCWCYEYNCRGDADGVKIGLFRINSTDLGLFADAYNKGDLKMDPVRICSDFDHIKVGLFRVNSADLGIFAANYNEGDLKVAPCPLDWDGDGDDDYNFWITP